jgi:ribosome-binding factor A
MESRHNERLAEALREELEEIINYELSDPRIGAAAVTEVLLAPDHRQARVRLSLSGEAGAQRETLAALEGARRHLRGLLAARLALYRVPELDFEPDLPVELSPRAKHLLRRVRKGRPKDAESSPIAPEGKKSPP